MWGRCISGVGQRVGKSVLHVCEGRNIISRTNHERLDLITLPTSGEGTYGTKPRSTHNEQARTTTKGYTQLHSDN